MKTELCWVIVLRSHGAESIVAAFPSARFAHDVFQKLFKRVGQREWLKLVPVKGLKVEFECPYWAMAEKP